MSKSTYKIRSPRTGLIVGFVSEYRFAVEFIERGFEIIEEVDVRLTSGLKNYDPAYGSPIFGV